MHIFFSKEVETNFIFRIGDQNSLPMMLEFQMRSFTFKLKNIVLYANTGVLCKRKCLKIRISCHFKDSY